MVTDPDILRGIARAAVARRDAAWARALWPQVDEPTLISVMPPGDAGDAVLGRIGQLVAAPRLAQYIAALPGKWSADLSKELVDRIRASPQAPAILMRCLVALESGLHADALADLQRWLSTGASTAEQGPLQFLVSSVSFRQSMTEAFP